MGCAMCSRGVEGQEWVDAVILGKKTPSQAAKHFTMSVDGVMTHVYEHTVLGVVPEDVIVKETKHKAASDVIDPSLGEFTGLVSMDFYSTEIMQILAYLKRYSRGLSIHQASGAKDVEVALKVMRELRLTIESLAEFQGRLSAKSHTTINIDSINMKYLSMTNVIRKDLCPSCRQIMLAAITEEDNVSNNRIQKIVPKTTSST